METNGYKHYCSEANAPRFADWIENRGGVALWGNLMIGDDTQWSTPALQEDGSPMGKPIYKATNEPIAIFTDPAEIGVQVFEEFKRFRVGLRMGAQGTMVKLTEASTRRLNKALEAAGIGATYVFDYDNQEAVVLRPKSTQSLKEWMASYVN